jgi:hypothetical protein
MSRRIFPLGFSPRVLEMSTARRLNVNEKFTVITYRNRFLLVATADGARL